MKTVCIFSLITLVSMFSCQDDDSVEYIGDYLIFGDYYGECLGKCRRTFKLEENRLLEDTQSQNLGQPYNFKEDYRVLDQAQFDRAQELLTIFPDQLLADPDSTFGCPDCYDQGGLYIEYKQGRKQGTWIIDQTQADVPAYLHEFMDRTNEVIRELSN